MPSYLYTVYKFPVIFSDFYNENQNFTIASVIQNNKHTPEPTRMQNLLTSYLLHTLKDPFGINLADSLELNESTNPGLYGFATLLKPDSAFSTKILAIATPGIKESTSAISTFISAQLGDIDYLVNKQTQRIEGDNRLLLQYALTKAVSIETQKILNQRG